MGSEFRNLPTQSPLQDKFSRFSNRIQDLVEQGRFFAADRLHFFAKKLRDPQYQRPKPGEVEVSMIFPQALFTDTLWVGSRYGCVTVASIYAQAIQNAKDLIVYQDQGWQLQIEKDGDVRRFRIPVDPLVETSEETN